MRMTVIGTGYVGTVHAACMADIGHEVLGIDIDAARIAMLAAGRAPIRETGLDTLLARAVASGRLHFTTSMDEGAAFARTHFLCVGTPQRHDSEAADLRYVDAVVDSLAPRLQPGSLLVGKSTVPVGTAARIGAGLTETAPDSEVAWNPEFLREGSAVADTMRPDRLVVGVGSAEAEETLRTVYAPMIRAGVPFFSTDLATAELVKVASNSFLATKISFINAMSEVCAAVNADATVLARAMGADSRIGERFLEPGLGFGGSCFPKDIRAFAARAEELGAGPAVGFLHEVDRINTRQRLRTVAFARHLLGDSLTDRRVAVFGAAFKPGSDDVRDSPALAVATALDQQGADVRIHDPQALDNARAAFPDLAYVPTVPDACENAELVLHLTAWPEYRQIDPAALALVVREPLLLDARNSLEEAVWQRAGWAIHGLGRPQTPVHGSITADSSDRPVLVAGGAS